MIVIGIDPGTARMGYALVELLQKKKPKLLAASVVVTHPDLEMHNRLKFLFDSLQTVAKQHIPETMVIERLFFNTNAKTAINVGQARGVAMLVAAHNKMKLLEYTALEAKHALTGYGRADKKQMQEAIREYFCLEKVVKPDDANDAVAMAVCFFKKDFAVEIN